MMRHEQNSQMNDLARRRLLVYVTELELEVDRLRRHGQLVYKEVWGTLGRCQELCTALTKEDSQAELTELVQEIRMLLTTLQDLRDSPGYHPAHDQVIAVAVRPLVEQIFRWQQRFLKAHDVTLRFEMDSEHVEWFPTRLRHILDSLISNALKYRDRAKAEQWVSLGLRECPDTYEFRVSDNGIGLEAEERDQMLDLFHRAVPTRNASPRVALAVVKLLVEQSGGTLEVESKPEQGTSFLVVLPRYELEDFLT